MKRDSLLYMAKLPLRGWLHRCEHCEAVTSRIIITIHGQATYVKYVCIPCRPSFLRWLFLQFDYVVVENETVAALVVKV